MSAANDIRDYLIANGITTPIYLGEVQDNSNISSNAIWCRGYSGRAPDRVFGTNTEVRYHKVQILVRGNPEDYSLSESICDAIYALLQSSRPTGYQDCKAMQSEFTELGEDENTRLYWTCNFELMKNYN